MANLLKTERDFDVALLEIEMEVEENYQKWLLEFRGSRLAHRQALPQVQTGQTPVQPPAPPTGTYP